MSNAGSRQVEVDAIRQADGHRPNFPSIKRVGRSILNQFGISRVRNCCPNILLATRAGEVSQMGSRRKFCGFDKKGLCRLNRMAEPRPEPLMQIKAGHEHLSMLPFPAFEAGSGVSP